MKSLFNCSKLVRSYSLGSVELMDIQNEKLANNYQPLDVCLKKGEGVYVYDVEGNKYYDFLSGYSALSQGHCHPHILKALNEQASELCLTSRAFYNDQIAYFAEFITDLLGYDEVCPMNTGAEAVDTALKLARKWGYEVKGIENEDAVIVCCNESFHGRTFAAISTSSNPEVKDGFRPLLPGILRVDFDDLEMLEETFNAIGEDICGFIVEPIQGEAGVRVPTEGYMAKVAELCKKHNVLLIADEIQVGLGRTGKMLCVDYDNIKPDVLILGKALGGGAYPVSAVLADREIMKVFGPGTHGSTFGGNPLAARVAIASLEVILEENLAENAFNMGNLFREKINELWTDEGIITEVRGKGLLNAVVFDHGHPKMREKDLNAYGICKILKKKGLLAKQTHQKIIRFSPALIMNEEQIMDCVDIISSTVLDIENN